MEIVQIQFNELKHWLARQCSRMSRSRAVSITIYVTFSSIGQIAHRLTPSDLEVWLLSLPPLEALEQLYVLELCRGESKKLLVHWECKDRQPPQINHPAVDHKRPCYGNILTEYDM
jgi:hypothetical protein